MDRVKKMNKEYSKKNKNTVDSKKASVLYKYASKIVNNRVLDLYLKGLGITVLTPTTLVPLALVMGATTFSDTVKDILSLEKRAGSTKKRSSKKSEKKDDMYIPILDDKVFGTYTKYTGAAVQLALSPFTLIPIGFAVAIYEWFQFMTEKKEQEGGGSGWLASQMSGGPINSANIWADRMSGKLGAFGHQMTPQDIAAITGYPFQQQPNTTLVIAPLAGPLGGTDVKTYQTGGRKSEKRIKRRSKSRGRVNQMYRRRRSKSRRSKSRRSKTN